MVGRKKWPHSHRPRWPRITSNCWGLRRWTVRRYSLMRSLCSNPPAIRRCRLANASNCGALSGFQYSSRSSGLTANCSQRIAKLMTGCTSKLPECHGPMCSGPAIGWNLRHVVVAAKLRALCRPCRLSERGAWLPTRNSRYNAKYPPRASVAELADALDLGSSARKGMGVRPSPFAPTSIPFLILFDTCLRISRWKSRNQVVSDAYQ